MNSEAFKGLSLRCASWNDQGWDTMMQFRVLFYYISLRIGILLEILKLNKIVSTPWYHVELL